QLPRELDGVRYSWIQGASCQWVCRRYVHSPHIAPLATRTSPALQIEHEPSRPCPRNADHDRAIPGPFFGRQQQVPVIRVSREQVRLARSTDALFAGTWRIDAALAHDLQNSPVCRHLGDDARARELDLEGLVVG